ncbi:uncharacterized protein [Eurosta solidaginis]|uniref:uncharacterized protein n=1 Tax=Eurosta solidaginis TaxID=178769 RepID=UPI003530B825
MEHTAERESSPQPSTSKSKPRSNSGRKRVQPSQPSVANVLRSFLTTRQNNLPQTTTASPIHSFFNAMADSMAALPQDLQLKAKGKIFAIVSEVEAENIERNARAFLSCAQNFGVPTQETFHCVDLWERQNLIPVVICLQSLCRKAHNFGKPSIGPKEADKNVRNFSEEQLRAGQNVISLQYSSN